MQAYGAQKDDGQALLEYLVATLLVLVVLVALAAIGGWWRTDAVAQNSFLDKTYTNIPNTPTTSRGPNVFFPEDIIVP